MPDWTWEMVPFEQRLADLIDEARVAGVGVDTIVSAMELQIMTQKEVLEAQG